MNQMSPYGDVNRGRTPAEPMATSHADNESWRFRMRALQETALLYGIQLLFRASLMLRRLNY